MHIMTKDGWKPLKVRATEEVPYGPEVYRGPIPSFECLAFVKGLEREHKEWADRRKTLVGE